MKKTVIFAVLVAFVLTITAYLPANAKDYTDAKIMINGQEMQAETQAIILEDSVREYILVPFSTLSEACGYNVVKENKTITATYEKTGDVISITSGEIIAQVNGKSVQMDTRASGFKDCYVVAWTFMAENTAAGIDIKWDEATRTIVVNCPVVSGNSADEQQKIEYTTASKPTPVAGPYADQVPVKMGRGISQRLVKAETPMFITCENNKGDWLILARGGYKKHATGEHVDHIVEYTGLDPWLTKELVLSGYRDTLDQWELLSINGVPWQLFDDPEVYPLDKLGLEFGLDEDDIEYITLHPESFQNAKISDDIKAIMNRTDGAYTCVRQKLPEQEKKMVSVYNDRTAVALYEHDKVRAEHLKTRPFMKDGQLFVPLRGIADYLGTEIGWNDATKTITLKQGERTINLQASEVVIKDGTTMIPLSFLSGQLGYTVKWMGDIKDDVLRADIYN